MIHPEPFVSAPLVSVIIPCFNQGRFLADAIASAQKQTYPNIEIIVADDGSTDNTRQVAMTQPNVIYCHQENGGLSAARNFGVTHSRGEFLVFLDADDVLYSGAIACNTRYLLENPAWRFVSGSHEKVDEWLNPLEKQEDAEVVTDNHYRALLRGNYIGMHAAVMYRRSVFDEFQFDTSLDACEDYDLYLKIARKYPVGSHRQKIAAYRHHGENMSRDIGRMYARVRLVHGRQRIALRGDAEMKAWKEGGAIWRKYYGEVLQAQLLAGIRKQTRWPSAGELLLLATTSPVVFAKYLRRKMRYSMTGVLKQLLPAAALRWLHRKGYYKKYTPSPGRINAGDFDRITPFSEEFGFDRGGAIDRLYIETFLEENQHRIAGRVLEIGDNAYTLRFGGDRILRSDILHVDHRNVRATYIGDITNIPELPSGEFDCIILTQTLHLIYDFKSALRTCYRILKPGGCLLLTVPGISNIDRGEWREYWLWSFTDVSVRKLMAETFNGAMVDIRTYGNVYVAAAFLYGMGLPESRKEFLFQHDPGYQVIISAVAIKA